MNGEVIKSFLVGLGFDVDDSSLAKFNKAIETASVRVTALYTTIQVAAAGIFYSISKISEGFEQMGYEYRIIAPAINKAIMLRRALLQAYQAAGINITRVVQQSVLFNYSLAKTKFALEAIYKSVGAKFLPLLTKQMDVFRSKIYANMPKIQAALQGFVQFIFKAFEATSQLGVRLWSILSRVYDFFVDLDKATSGWSTKILAVAAAWKLLNLEFLATPLGATIAGLVALLALYDDFKTFQEGGQSLFDWTKVAGFVQQLLSFGENFLNIMKDAAHYLGVLFDIALKLIHLDFKGAFAEIPDLFRAAGKVIGDLIDRVVSLFNIFKTLGSSDFLGGKSPYVNPSNFATPPVNPATINNGSNQTVSQQTSITVQGSADANATASKVANQQSQVNYNMVRNLKGATR